MLIRLIANGVASVRRHGLATAIASYWSRLHERIDERKLGIQTGGIIGLKELGLDDHEERREHYPTHLSHFQCMKRFMQPETPNEVFMDYGAGLGRVLILAAMLPFKRVIGIEISPTLVERARANIIRCRGQLLCKDVEIIAQDATAFEVPTDVAVIYFNNPFVGKILASVLNQIKLSYQRRPRRIRLICNVPSECEFLSQICRAEEVQLQHQANLGRDRRCLVFLMKEQ